MFRRGVFFLVQTGRLLLGKLLAIAGGYRRLASEDGAGDAFEKKYHGVI